MRPLSLLLCLDFLLIEYQAIQAQPKDGLPGLQGFDLAEAARGTQVTLKLTQPEPKKDSSNLFLWLKHREPIPKSIGPAREGDTDPFGPFKVAIDKVWLPERLPLGSYRAGLTIGDQKPNDEQAQYTASLNITRGPTLRPVINAVHPTTAYPATAPT